MKNITLVENFTGTGTTDVSVITGSKAEISIIGDSFDSVTFEDNKHDLGWADILDAQTGDIVSISANTHELNLNPSPVTARSIRATITNGANVTVIISQGI